MKKFLNPKIAYFALAITLLLVLIPVNLDSIEAQPQLDAMQVSKMDSLLSYMIWKHQQGELSGIPEVDAALAASKVPVSIRFNEEMPSTGINAFEMETGVEFTFVDGKVLHAGGIYPASIPWDNVEATAQKPDVLRIESAVSIIEPTLDISVPEIGADQVWSILDVNMMNKTGEGIIIADLDTGVDYNHEVFYYPNGTGKVLRMYDSTGEYVRPALGGATLDSNGHGTSVSHILLGGQIGGAGNPGTYVGVAPSAGLFAVKVFDPNGVDEVVGATWADNRGADVMIYEFGSWSFGRFLDGSSNREAAIDNLATTGNMTVQVVPAGNLAGNWLGPDGTAGTGDEAAGPGSERHARTTVPAGGSTDFGIETRGHAYYGPGNLEQEFIWITVLWRTPANNLQINITTPTPQGPYMLPLPASPGWATTPTADGMAIDSNRDNSARGTAAINIILYNQNGTGWPLLMGPWTVTVINNGAAGEDVNLYNNDGFGWQGGAYWTNFRDDSMTITDPSTADEAISVASYATRAQVTGTVGDFSFFTGMGPRIDGTQKPDIAAPGHYDITTATIPPNTYRIDFGGTSAAGPHVAGTAALMLQADPTLTHSDVKTNIRNTARTDAFTGVVPNSIWGWGKLDAYAAVEAVEQVIHDVEAFHQHPTAPTAVQGDIVPVVVDVRNNGNHPETFDVYAWAESAANSYPIGTQTVTNLAPAGGTQALIYNWDTTGVIGDAYNIYAMADSGRVIVETDEVNNNCTSQATIRIMVPPVADPDGPYSGPEGFFIPLDGRGSYDPDGTVVSWEWDLDGDGAYDDASGDQVSWVWGHAGMYTIGLNVTDNDGLWDTDSTEVTVNNVAPAVDAGPDQEALPGHHYTEFCFTGTFTDPSWLDTHTAIWDFGDGSPTEAGVVTYQPTTPPDPAIGIVDESPRCHKYWVPYQDTYTVTLTVTDDSGDVGIDTLTVTILRVIGGEEVPLDLGAVVASALYSFWWVPTLMAVAIAIVYIKRRHR